jgi:hypothetical protein
MDYNGTDRRSTGTGWVDVAIRPSKGVVTIASQCGGFLGTGYFKWLLFIPKHRRIK